jgi:hypothetical protein
MLEVCESDRIRTKFDVFGSDFFSSIGSDFGSFSVGSNWIIQLLYGFRVWMA